VTSTNSKRGQREYYIYHLAVSAEHRRHRVATALMGYLREIAARRGGWVIYVQANHGDDEAIALYEKHGARHQALHSILAWCRLCDDRPHSWHGAKRVIPGPAAPAHQASSHDLRDVARSLSHGRRARFVESGARAAEPSDFAAAADFSTQAIDTGGLCRVDLAAVLTGRGVAYDMMGQTERAIGDLTSRAFQRVDLVVCRAAASALCM
jgi:hypothetical protein